MDTRTPAEGRVLSAMSAPSAGWIVNGIKCQKSFRSPQYSAYYFVFYFETLRFLYAL